MIVAEICRTLPKMDKENKKKKKWGERKKKLSNDKFVANRFLNLLEYTLIIKYVLINVVEEKRVNSFERTCRNRYIACVTSL